MRRRCGRKGRGIALELAEGKGRESGDRKNGGRPLETLPSDS